MSTNLVWIPHPVLGWEVGEPCRGKKCSFKGIQSGTVIELDESQAENLRIVMPSTVSDKFNDLVDMEEMSECAVLHQIRERYTSDEIYTNIGDILVSVNPFKQLMIYTSKVLGEYTESFLERPPHIFSTAAAAFQGLKAGEGEQAIVISGESGSGKTSATKLVLQFLSEVAGSPSGVEQKMLLSNPVLEAFGNAKTLRNDNSSRFGKWMEIQFDESYLICGTKMNNYLLEKSRVVHHSENERSFHIFYQLCAGASNEQREMYQIGPSSDFEYLSGNGIIKGVDDKKDFVETMGALRKLGFEEEKIELLIRVLAIVLHLGNIEFEEDENEVVSISGSVEFIASLLKIDSKSFSTALLFNTVTIRSEAQKIALRKSDVINSRDSLAKVLYHQLFSWLVSEINSTLISTNVHGTIGLLDIFGFEEFQTNSFEQFCINFTNETLQRHFNECIFEQELREYKREEIDISEITYTDNVECIKLFGGILQVMDDHVRIPKATDSSLLGALSDEFGKQKHFRKPRFNGLFEIRHYAGTVSYSIDGFIYKNTDILHESLRECMRSSDVSLVSVGFFPDMAMDSNSSRRMNNHGLGTKFLKQLNSLMNNIRARNCSFVRCLKPNENLESNNFDSQKVLQQLHHSGLFEATRIRSEGYSFKKPFVSFLNRFRALDPLLNSGEAKRAQTCSFFQHLKIPENQFKLGRTKIFYRHEAMLKLEKLRETMYFERARLLQAAVRRMLARVHQRKLENVIKRTCIAVGKGLLADLLSIRMEALNLEMQLFIETDLNGPIKYLQEEARIVSLLKRGMESENFNILSGALEEAERIQIESKTKSADVSETLTNAKQVLYKLTHKAKLVKELKNADSADFGRLEECVAEAKTLGLDVIEAEKKLKSYQSISKLYSQLESALSKRGAGWLEILVKRWKAVQKLVVDGQTAAQEELVCKTRETVLKEYHRLLISAMSEKNMQSLHEILKQIKDVHLEGDLGEELEEVERFRSIEQKRIQTIQLKNSDSIDSLDISRSRSVTNRDVIGMLNDFENNFLERERARTINNESKIERVMEHEDLTQQLLEAMNSRDKTQIENFRDALSNSDEMANTLIVKANLTIETIELEESLNSQLKQSVEALDRSAMNSVLTRMVEIGMSDTEEIKRARHLCFVLSEEQFHNLKLEKAFENGNLSKLSSLLSEADSKGFVIDNEMEIRSFIEGDCSLRSGTLGSTSLHEGLDLYETFRLLRGTFPLSEMYLLRSAMNFSRRFLLSNRSISDRMCIWQNEPLNKSLIHLSADYCGSRSRSREIKKEALEVFKSILGYMKDVYHPFPNTLASEVLWRGYEEPLLRDEIFCQLVKQTTANISEPSLRLGWKLIYLCLQTFPPHSLEMEKVLLSHIAEFAEPTSAVDAKLNTIEDIATACYRAINERITKGVASNVPSLEEITEFTALR